MIVLTCSLLRPLLLVTGVPGQVLLLEAEDDMKSKRISEIQDVLAEKMQDNLLADSAVWQYVAMFSNRWKIVAELILQDLDVLKMELRQKEAKFAVDHGHSWTFMDFVSWVASRESQRFGRSWCINFRWFLDN